MVDRDAPSRLAPSSLREDLLFPADSSALEDDDVGVPQVKKMKNGRDEKW